MNNQMGTGAINGLSESEVQNVVQSTQKGHEMNKKQANKSPLELAGYQGAEMVEQAALTQNHGKALCQGQQVQRKKTGQVNPAAVLGYVYLMTTIDSELAANDPQFTKLEAIEGARQNDDGLTGRARRLNHKLAILRKTGGSHD
ncbi:hypothetical protein D3C73_942550 [compost metagenome]|jgi:hypothetical protein